MDKTIQKRAEFWLTEAFDQDTRQQVKALLNGDQAVLEDAFYKDLEFGTGGLRGVMGAGTNRMNKYTVGIATQGLSNYLLACFPKQQIKVAIAHDCRNKSDYFSQIATDVFTANGIEVYHFNALRPTPELSFAIRQLGCQSGVVVTASHNPPEYNGYKVYWEDGAQIVAPHDKAIIAEVRAIESPKEVKFNGDENLSFDITTRIDEAYRKMVMAQRLSPKAIANQHQISLVYTSLHGTGITHTPDILHEMGFTNVHIVEAQRVPNGNFPTVVSPNPEERDAMKLALEEGEKQHAELVMGTDPDADRVGLAIRDENGKLELINGNQACALLVYYLLEQHTQAGTMPKNPFICKTVVTTELIDDMCLSFGINCYNTLTGFKHIASVIREKEGKEIFLGGGEESYGCMIGAEVRDKDGIASSAMFSEICAWAKDQGRSLFEVFVEIYKKYGFYRERLVYLVRKGKEGTQIINDLMEGYRRNPPAEIAGSQVVKICDYLEDRISDLKTGEAHSTGLPKSNVIQFYLENGDKVTARPSGTEPKIKYYFSVHTELLNNAAYTEKLSQLEKRIDELVDAMNIAEA